MSVLFMGRVQLVAFLILNTILVCYATAAEATQHHHKQRQSFHEAEINSGKTSNGKIINGKEAKTAAPRRLSESHLNRGSKKNYEVGAAPPPQRAAVHFRQRNQASRKAVATSSKSETSANLSTISHRYASPQEPSSAAQLSTQYEIPRVGIDRVDSHKGQREERPLSSQLSASLPIQENALPDVKSRRMGSSQNENLPTSERSPLKKLSRSRMTTTTTTTLAPTAPTPRNELLENIPQEMSFNFVPTYFWKLSGPPAESTSTRKLPKKFKPTTSTLSESSQRSKHITTTHKITSDNSAKHYQDDDGPFRIALPTINFLNSSMKAGEQDGEKEKGKRATLQSLRERFNCPRESEVRFQLFPKICKVDKDCSIWNRDELCCEIFGAKSCVSGVPKPLEETSHTPILGLIPRKCPRRPLAELWWDVKECATDNDCWPRVCCPDGRRRYCRTSEPELEVVPTPVKRSFNYLTEYLECTPPPPPIFDVHPKACISTFDCFPNVCCQEAGLRHCRPPKKSVLTLMANFLNVGFVKRLTQNIVIK